MNRPQPRGMKYEFLLELDIAEDLFHAGGQVEGSGLGLAIAKWISDLHHADLLVSKEQKGATFRIVFPSSNP